MGAYRNFDAALEEKRAKETGERPVLVAFRLGGEDFLVADMPGSVLFRASVAFGSDGTRYDPNTPEGRKAIERDGTKVLAAFSGIFSDLFGDHYDRFLDALGRSRMDMVETYEFVEWLVNEAAEAASARPTEPPSDSASSSSSNGTSSNLVSVSSDSTASPS